MIHDVEGTQSIHPTHPTLTTGTTSETCPNTVTLASDGSNSYLCWGVSSLQGLRPTHEDYHIAEGHLIGDSMSLFAVFDGHGGSDCSQYLAEHYAQKIKERIESSRTRGVLHDKYHHRSMSHLLRTTSIVQDSFLEIDQEFRETFQRSAKPLTPPVQPYPSLPQLPTDVVAVVHKAQSSSSSTTSSSSGTSPKLAHEKSSGSTANVLFVESCGSGTIELTCANVGDSRCLVYDKGKIFALSRDHKPTDPLERRRIELSGGYVRRKRLDGHLAMSRAFGDFEDKSVKNVQPQNQPLIVTPDLRPLTVQLSKSKEEQFIVVACDGLFDSLDSVEICEYIKERLCWHSARTIAKDLAEHAIEKGSKDNVTVILVILSPIPHFRSIPITTS